MGNNFRFFLPFEIQKSKDENGKEVEVMKVSGIASTADRDSDEEVLDPQGFDLSYFNQHGYVNWNHQAGNNPDAVIGEPTKAEIRKEGLYVEAILYPESPTAVKVFNLAKTLEKSSDKRRLGFSIEGKVLERDSLDERYVKKAKITGLAITATPKNSKTFLDIIKGNFSDFETETDLDSDLLDANGGTEYIIDITKPDGERITVDRQYNIKVFKSVNTVDSSALMRESVEGNVKNLDSSTKKDKKSLDNSKKDNKFVTFNKSELFGNLIDKTNSVEIAKSTLNLINFEMKDKTVKIDELETVLKSLGVNLIKGETNEPPKSEKKEEDPKIEKSNDSDEDDDAMEKAIAEKQKEVDMMKAKLDEKKSKTPVSKEDIEDIKKSFNNELEKSQVNMIESLNRIADLMKSSVETLSSRIAAIEEQPIAKPKSLLTSKSIEKSFQGNEMTPSGRVQMSITRNKKELSDILLVKSGIEKGQVNDFYASEVTNFESTGYLSKAVIQDLFINDKIEIVE